MNRREFMELLTLAAGGLMAPRRKWWDFGAGPRFQAFTLDDLDALVAEATVLGAGPPDVLWMDEAQEARLRELMGGRAKVMGQWLTYQGIPILDANPMAFSGIRILETPQRELTLVGMDGRAARLHRELPRPAWSDWGHHIPERTLESTEIRR